MTTPEPGRSDRPDTTRSSRFSRPARTRPPRPTPPKLIDIARWLFILSAVVGMVRFMVQLADREMLIRELRVQQPTLSQDDLDAAATGGIVFGLVIAAGLILVYTLLANRMAGGRNWARVVLTVIAAAGILLGVLRLLSAATGFTAASGLSVNGIDLAFGVVTMLIDGAAVVLMYQTSVSGYFKPRPPVAPGPAPR